MRRLIVLVALLTTGCGSSSAPAAPSAGAAPVVLTLALSGQSNAARVAPALSQVAHLAGYALGGAPISFFAADGDSWARLTQGLNAWQFTGEPLTGALPPITPHPLDAFVWWQGESDQATPDYYEQLDDLVKRVRAITSPTLLVAVMQLGKPFATGYPYPDGVNGAYEGERWARTHDHALFIETQDLPYLDDETHMTDEGYRLAAARIVSRLTR